MAWWWPFGGHSRAENQAALDALATFGEPKDELKLDPSLVADQLQQAMSALHKDMAKLHEDARRMASDARQVAERIGFDLDQFRIAVHQVLNRHHDVD